MTNLRASSQGHQAGLDPDATAQQQLATRLLWAGSDDENNALLELPPLE